MRDNEHLVRRESIKWSYDDPASITRAIESMANDPEVLREVQAIERDFAPTLNDGLTEPPYNAECQKEGFTR